MNLFAKSFAEKNKRGLHFLIKAGFPILYRVRAVFHVPFHTIPFFAERRVVIVPFSSFMASFMEQICMFFSPVRFYIVKRFYRNLLLEFACDFT